MALVVEDGTGLATATAYISVSFADTYHRDRGNTAWESVAYQTKEASILKATEWLDAEYYFMGEMRFPDTPQALSWPRIGVTDEECNSIADDEVPLRIQRATAELALALAGNTDGGASPSVIAGNTTRRRERVGVVESETEGSVDSNSRVYPRVHQLVAPLVIGKRSGGGSVPALRG